MRKEKKQNSIFTTTGVSLLLTVFLILCLVTFACLSLSTAKSDYDLSKANADHRTAYYDACNKAEENLNDLTHGRTDKTSWKIPIGDKQALDVRVETTGSSPYGGQSYTIKKWKVVSTVEHDYNQSMNLIK